jgi:hypothetical protein
MKQPLKDLIDKKRKELQDQQRDEEAKEQDMKSGTQQIQRPMNTPENFPILEEKCLHVASSMYLLGDCPICSRCGQAAYNVFHDKWFVTDTKFMEMLAEELARAELEQLKK